MLHHQNSIFNSEIVHVSCRLGLKLRLLGGKGGCLDR